MKISRSLFAVIASLAWTLPQSAYCQQCITYTVELNSYVSESTDGSNIYTSVEVEGPVSMNFDPSCASHLPPYVYQWVHTPGTYNKISIPGGGSVGGWSYGSSVCENCYMDSVNTQSIAATPGVQYDFSWKTNAICSGGGQFYGDSGDFGIGLGYTIGQEVACNPTSYIGKYVPACTNGSPKCPIDNAEKAWYIQFGRDELCWVYARTPWLIIYQGGSVTQCINPIVSVEASGPGPCI